MPSTNIEYAELASNGKPIDGRALVRVLIGPPGAGKTTLCEHEGWRFGTCLSLDAARADLGAGAHDQTATPAAVEHVELQAHALLAAGADVTIDATSTTAAERSTWLAVAKEHEAAAVAVIVRTPLETALARNAGRAQPVPEAVVKLFGQRVALLSAADLVKKEHFSRVWACTPPERASLRSVPQPWDGLARR
ncbi:ATP-binding protein (plasmid) [Amycolatopsis sp. FU40]|uniref:ATP-binding protein n=1 Tax=Amycolatopsis sp. FU40 TaxID=2914159 RepID=UPI001F25E141|nr:ATP-binding protein [Amycolatopsis sp. FU40]UKD50873.1 ATP-binding protein [Amycolatopsis sp. FU40]